MKKVLAVLLLCFTLCGVASANELVLYGPGDWFVYYVAGRGVSWLYNNWNNPHAARPGAWDTDGCMGRSGWNACQQDPYGGGGGGGW